MASEAGLQEGSKARPEGARAKRNRATVLSSRDVMTRSDKARMQAGVHTSSQSAPHSLGSTPTVPKPLFLAPMIPEARRQHESWGARRGRAGRQAGSAGDDDRTGTTARQRCKHTHKLQFLCSWHCTVAPGTITTCAHAHTHTPATLVPWSYMSQHAFKSLSGSLGDSTSLKLMLNTTLRSLWLQSTPESTTATVVGAMSLTVVQPVGELLLASMANTRFMSLVTASPDSSGSVVRRGCARGRQAGKQAGRQQGSSMHKGGEGCAVS